MEDKTKSVAELATEILESIEKGEMTINQAREKFGLEPIDVPSADNFLKKV